MQSIACGQLRKLRVELQSPVVYHLPVGDELIHLNPLLGQAISLRFIGEISCLHCGRKTKKSFSQGYCYPCFSSLAQCDICIVSPEKCHYEQGTCREPDWAQKHCMREHIVYLANSSGIKVGITRGTQMPTRWIDQGAIQALPVYRVDNRYLSGLVEVICKQHMADKTNWRKMLKGEVEAINLVERRDELFAVINTEVDALVDQFGLQSLQAITAGELVAINYPVLSYPTKVVSKNFDKQPLIEGTLVGIKGQYLILDTGVLNIRKFGAYQIELSA